jgi:hypothetical protein
MFNYLKNLWLLYRGQFNSEFPSLLGGMNLLEDGSPADSAVWYGWQEILSGKPMLTEKEAFNAMLKLVSFYRTYSEYDELPRVLEIINTISPALQENWRKCVQDVIDG